MANPLTSPMIVSAGVLVEGGRVLLTQRKVGSHLEGAWEFPGGKVEPHEDPKTALARELREELGIETAVGEIVEVTFHRYPDRTVLLLFYRAMRLVDSPAPRALDVAAFRWAAHPELIDSHFPPADLAVLEKVRALLREQSD